MPITPSSDGYCELADIQSLLQQFTIDATSNPNTTEVESWIREDFAEINACLRQAGYAAPVAQAGGSLSASPGTIQVAQAAPIASYGLRLSGSGGTLTGKASRGDFFLVAGDAQRYMVLEETYANGGEAALLIAPALEKAASAGAAITYTAVNDAALVLKKLNALMTQIRVYAAAYSASGAAVSEIVSPLQKDRDRMLKAIREGAYDFPAAALAQQSKGLSLARLVRT